MNSLDQLQSWLDKEAIRQQIVNYSRSMDRLDVDLGKAVFHPTSTVDYGEFFTGSGWELIEKCIASHRGLIATSHQMSTISIWLDGTDSARSETYGDCTMRLSIDGSGVASDLRSLVRYLDRWERYDGHWVIVHRVAVLDIVQRVTERMAAVPRAISNS